MRVICTISMHLLLCMAIVPAAAQEVPESLRTGPTTPELERRDQPVTKEDLQILARADEILASDSLWNRADDRNCDDDESNGTVSLFCALRMACVEVLGLYDHRRVAIQEVRFAIEEAADGQEFSHRLMDYNNLPTTTFADVKKILQVATERVAMRLNNAE